MRRPNSGNRPHIISFSDLNNYQVAQVRQREAGQKFRRTKDDRYDELEDDDWLDVVVMFGPEPWDKTKEVKDNPNCRICGGKDFIGVGKKVYCAGCSRSGIVEPMNDTEWMSGYQKIRPRAGSRTKKSRKPKSSSELPSQTKGESNG